MKSFSFLIAVFTAFLIQHAVADLEWTPTGDGVSTYQEANWVDLQTGQVPSANSVNANTLVNQSLIVRRGIPGGGSGAGGNLLLGSGSLAVSNAVFRMSKGASAGIDMGATNQELTLTDAKLLTNHLISAEVTMSGRSEITLYGSNPLTNTTIDLKSSDCFVFFLDRLPTQVDTNYLGQFTVDGAPAVLNSNVEIRQYYNGAVLRRKLGSGVAMKAFAEQDYLGQRWSMTTGFKGRVGLGFSAFDSGIYTVSGWGADIWNTTDECHFLYRELSGDGEVIAKVNSLVNTNFSAKAGLMIREDFSGESRNAFIFQRPNKTVLFQSRATPGANTTSSSAQGGTDNVKWLRLIRAGNVFTAFYSTTSGTGPWTQLGTPKTVTMNNSVFVGLAVTSHIGVERTIAEFANVSMSEGGVNANTSQIGIFDATREIDGVWAPEDQISSFLLKKGYMAVLAEDAGGQGFSKFYAATEADLFVNLPPELDNKVSYIRILPWRWIAKKGWCGANNTFPNTIQAHWKYEWEPTGASVLNWEFVPMIKGRSQEKDFRWEEVRVRANQTHFLGFNEPEAANQGDLTVDEAIALWPKAQQLGLRLGSPARTDGQNGVNWLDEFMTKADAKGYRVDYTCVHNYNRMNAAGLKSFLDAEFARYGRPIWLTEFQRADDDNPDSADNLAYLEEVLPMLEGLDYLERYSYYNFTIPGSPNTSASLFNGDNTVNAKGVLYRDLNSNPAYRNTGQPVWASASLNLTNLELVNIANGGSLASTSSLDLSLVNQVEFFANGISLGSDTTAPFEIPKSSLSPGTQTIHSVTTTSFGETIVSPAVQIFVEDLNLQAVINADGIITWQATPGENYRLETSPDLMTWSFVSNHLATGLTESVSVPSWAMNLRQFYRIVQD